MSSRILVALWVILSIQLLPHSSPAQPAPRRLLLQDIVPQGVPEALARSLTDLLEIEIERGRLFEVISVQDVRHLLQAEEQRMLLGTDENQDEHLTRIGKKVDAPYILAGTLGKIGNAYQLALRLLDVAQAKAVRRVNQTLVGEEGGLSGSLRSAALALTLEEKGVAADISASLIEDLKVAEKPKSWFFSLSPAYEVDVGLNTSSGEGGILVYRPVYYTLRLDVEWALLDWLRLFGSVSVGTSFPARQQDDNNRVIATRDSTTDEVVSGSGSLQASQLSLNYTATKIPIDLGVKFSPPRGRFLPFALVGVGLSWYQYQFDDSHLSLLQQQENGSCPATYNPIDVSGGQMCALEADLTSEGAISSLAFDTIAALGFEWLLTQHWGLKVDVRYRMSYLFQDESGLRHSYTGRTADYAQDTQQVYDSFDEVSEIQRLNLGLEFSAGVIGYW